MANLSNLLGNLYQGGDEPDRTVDAGRSPAPRTGRGPDWASDDRLDAAFEDWTAGEMPGMDRDERESLHDDDPGHTDPVPEAVEPDALDDAAEADEPIEVSMPRSVAAGELVGEPARPLRPTDDGDAPLTDFTAVVERTAAPTAADMPWPDAIPAEPDEPWELHHDDILPGRGGAGGGLLARLRGR